jgi:hypothetical protein|nr:hypothetical protein [Xanthomonas massiliensis]
MHRHVCRLLFLLLPVFGARASDVPALSHGCTYGADTAHDPDAASATIPGASRTAPRAIAPGVTTGGGSDGESLLPRSRLPRWHSFLPGMFR